MENCVNFGLVKNKAINMVKRGSFVLSSGNTTDFWININDLTREPDVFDELLNITKNLLGKLRKIHKTDLVIIMPKFNDAYHNDSFMDCIVTLANRKANDIVYINERKNDFQITDATRIECLNRPCVLVLPVSSYEKALQKISTEIFDKIQCSNLYLYTFLFREIEKLEDIVNRGITVLPVLVSLGADEIYSIDEINNKISPSSPLSMKQFEILNNSKNWFLD